MRIGFEVAATDPLDKHNFLQTSRFGMERCYFDRIFQIGVDCHHKGHLLEQARAAAGAFIGLALEVGMAALGPDVPRILDIGVSHAIVSPWLARGPPERPPPQPEKPWKSSVDATQISSDSRFFAIFWCTDF